MSIRDLFEKCDEKIIKCSSDLFKVTPREKLCFNQVIEPGSLKK